MSKINIEVSARHIHLSQNDLEKLFGRGYRLKFLKPLSQPGQFAANEAVKIKTRQGEFLGVRVLGPVRRETQVEISLTDAYVLGVKAPLRLSGDLKGSVRVKIIGPGGSVDLRRGVIVARRHIHATPENAEKYGLHHNQRVSVTVNEGERKLVFKDVAVRVSRRYAWVCHVDTDEGNAAGITGMTCGEVTVL